MSTYTVGQQIKFTTYKCKCKDAPETIEMTGKISSIIVTPAPDNKTWYRTVLDGGLVTTVLEADVIGLA